MSIYRIPAVSPVITAQAGHVAFDEHFLNGASADLSVNGSVTPVEFAIDAHATYDKYIKAIYFHIEAKGMNPGTAEGRNFSTLNALTTGLILSWSVGGNTYTYAGDPIKKTHDFYTWAQGEQNVTFDADAVAATVDYFGAHIQFNGTVKLNAGSADKAYITVADDLSTADITLLEVHADSYLSL
jgi:hypothetical protein